MTIWEQNELAERKKLSAGAPKKMKTFAESNKSKKSKKKAQQKKEAEEAKQLEEKNYVKPEPMINSA